MNAFKRMLIGILAVVGMALSTSPSAAGEPAAVTVGYHLGRPVIMIDGVPQVLPAYSPAGWGRRPNGFHRAVPRFATHDMGVYLLCMPYDLERFLWDHPDQWREPAAAHPNSIPLREQAAFILKQHPEARFIVRYGPSESAAWREAHPEQLFVTETGERLPMPSMASMAYWQAAARLTEAAVSYCEAEPWGDRIIGYWNGLRIEGTTEQIVRGWLYDHSELMLGRYRQYLRATYGTDAALAAAWGREVMIDTATIPTDPLLGPLPEVSELLYWQDAVQNQPLRDYLRLQGQLFHEGFRLFAAANRGATERQRVYLYDAFKMSMLGWHNFGFFNMKMSYPLAYQETLAASGHMDVTALFDAEGFDGIITPHDYQARGIGGIYEPEGMADSAVLRGKLFWAEMDTRSYGVDDNDYFEAKNAQEFAAVTWRNLATTLTRGFHSYWMDLHRDWFTTDDMHAIIHRQVEVYRESVDWPHADVPGIAMILDDRAVLETNGDGSFFHQAIMWEQKMGLARCGVPWRVYQFDDLTLDNFPAHRVFYFPNLFHCDDARLKVLREKVFRDGNVVLWGPGSGISDGKTIQTLSATRLTGFQFTMIKLNHPRRYQVQDYSHTITAGMDEGVIVGDSLPYGPLLFPTYGTRLAMAWTKQGRVHSGLAIKEFGRGARGAYTGDEPLGAGDWSSVFTTAVPLPADLWRGLARHAGTHVYSETNDVLMADAHMVALHSIRSGGKHLRLPAAYAVVDVITGERLYSSTRDIRFTIHAPETRVFRLLPPEEPAP